MALGAMSGKHDSIHQDNAVPKRVRIITAGAISDGASEEGDECGKKKSLWVIYYAMISLQFSNCHSLSWVLFSKHSRLQAKEISQEAHQHRGD
jgi:hypothetical protein